MERENWFRFYNFANGVLIMGLLWLYFKYKDQLPARIPVHFRLDGRPDGWSKPESLLWLILIAIGITVFMYILIIFLPKFFKQPKYMNIPRKNIVLNLPEKQFKIYIAFTAEYMAAVAFSMNIMWLTIVYSTIIMVQEGLKKQPWWSIWPALFLLFVLIGYYTWKLYVIPKQLQHQAEQETSGSAYRF